MMALKKATSYFHIVLLMYKIGHFTASMLLLGR